MAQLNPNYQTTKLTQSARWPWTGSPDHRVAVSFRLNNPRRIEGDVTVRLYWASGPTLQAEYVQPAGEKIFTVSKPNWFGNKSLRFANDELTLRPAQSTHLIAIVNGDHAVPESNLHDNSVVATLAPRTFIFRIGGGLSSAQSDLDAINVRSVAEGYPHPVISFPTVRVPWYSAVSGPVLVQNARRHIEVSLQQYHWRESDQVIGRIRDLSGICVIKADLVRVRKMGSRANCLTQSHSAGFQESSVGQYNTPP